jgi:hypothetical protein
MTEANLPSDSIQPSRAYELMRTKLGTDGMSQLQTQLDIWHDLNQSEHLDSPLRKALESGQEPVLPKCTLIHGVRYDADVLKSIAELGIMSGELVGVVEDSETHGCADFFKVPADMSVADYFTWVREPDLTGRLRSPKGENNFLGRHVGVIIDPKAQGVAELLQKDAYLDPTMDFTRLPNTRTPDRTAAILGGVPRGAIAGLLFSEMTAQNSAKMAEVAQIFPTIPLLTQTGALVQPPTTAL